MSTKTSEFVRAAMRSAQKKNVRRSHKPAARATPTEGPRIAVKRDSAGGRASVLNPLDRNRGGRAERRGGAVLEESSTGKASRKSTRASIDHTKRTTNLQLRAVRALNAPSTRARARR